MLSSPMYLGEQIGILADFSISHCSSRSHYSLGTTGLVSRCSMWAPNCLLLMIYSILHCTDTCKIAPFSVITVQVSASPSPHLLKQGQFFREAYPQLV
ncbi:hypothetical protein XELAEV_18031154mg [Xenopus laevis]|uniref:Uncharacterized protein n=1 Tax=Xenopus laevis TaxID=8355 RepID=A0A974CM60_XENLA|nr:hypothetical protein XELAEV_18031154mg [Xenopus laevis]